MKLSRSVVLLLLVGLMALLIAQVAHADGPTPPTPQPPVSVTPPPPIDPLAAAKAIDAAYADAAKYQSDAANLVSGMQATLNQANASLAVANGSLSAAYGALNSAQASIGQYQASVAQYQILLKQSEDARVAAQQGQIQQAVDLANAAQLAGSKVLSLASDSNRSAMQSALQANQAVQDVLELRTQLSRSENQIRFEQQANADLIKTNAAQSYRLDQLEPYALDTYHHAMAAWVLSAVLGLVLIAVLLMLVIVFAVERRNRWPRLKQNLDGAVVLPIAKQLVDSDRME